ncbi:MAG: TolC family protein [Bdellovibrionales bacterium]|nr:TolC family protein [Bdellovibrionales bacterium]
MLTAVLVLSLAAQAQEKAAAAPALTLQQYMEQVKSGNPEGRALVQNVEMSSLRLDEADAPYSPDLYSEYRLFNDGKEPTNGFSPKETRGRQWKVGVRDKTTFGLSADVYMLSQHTTLIGAPAMLNPSDYETSTMGINLQQSLWRNGFGEVERSNRDAALAASRVNLLRSKFALKNLLLKAENTYWSVVSYNQIIKLQEENVDRAKRLRDWMKQRADMRLFDDVDALQAQAAFEKRELELETSMDERAAMIRAFNTLRGQNSDEAPTLSELPSQEALTKAASDKSKRMSREDFRLIYEEAEANLNRATASISALRPQLDLVGSLASNGLDASSVGDAQSEATRGKYPSWSVGVVFSVPLDYSLIGNMKRSYKVQKSAAVDMKEQARFSEERAWDDLLKQNREAQGRFTRAVNLENLQTDLVQKERRRLMNGRSTTNQSLTIEQGLAEAQIQRVKAQLGLLQLHNVIKQFEEVP